MLSRHNVSWMPPQNNFNSAHRTHYLSKIYPTEGRRKAYLCCGTQHHPATVDHINLNYVQPHSFFPFISACRDAHTLLRPEASCGREIKFSTIMEMVFRFPHHHPTPTPQSLLPLPLSL